MFKRCFPALLAFFMLFISHVCIAAEFECALCPREYQPRIIPKIELSIFEDPSVESTVAGGKLPGGSEIEYNQTLYRTVKSGSALVVESVSTIGRSYGPVTYLSRDDYYYTGNRVPIELNSGESIEYLQKRAEGEGFVKIDGDVIAFDILVLAAPKKMKIEITSEPVTEWWVQVVDDEKLPVGWVLIDNETVDFIFP